MFRLIWTTGVSIRDFLQRYMPSNTLIRATRRRAGLKWGVPAMLVAGIYLVIAATLVQWIADGGPGWVNLAVLVCLWNALKFVVNGPVTLVLLMRVRSAEPRERTARGRDHARGGASAAPSPVCGAQL
ncbi:sulfate permease [Demequina sp.]|uniref:sulfate permease n=1 Tax=Demequina sp. TaxID=2050685 RepID=UPI003A867250